LSSVTNLLEPDLTMTFLDKIVASTRVHKKPVPPVSWMQD